MSSRKSLWSRSVYWRWILISTLLATILAVYAGLRKPSQSAITGSYKAPPPSSPGMISRQGGKRLQRLTTAHANPYVGQIPTGNQTSSSKADPKKTFDLPIRQEPGTFPPDTEMHLIGVYQGAPPDGQKRIPWWAKCKDIGLDISDPNAGKKCHELLAGKRETYGVTVSVTRNTPMVLVLMGYEPILWKITGTGHSNIKKIILGGYYGQDIEGVSKGIPIEVHTHKASHCKQCDRKAGYFYAYKKQSGEYKKAIHFLQVWTGLYPTSFQGAYEENSFSVSDSIISNISWNTQNAGKTADPYRGKIFVDSVSLAGREIPLPDGNWEGIFFETIPSSRGRDEILVLADIHRQIFKKLVAIRVREANDAKGFPRNSSCTQKSVYGGKTLKNTPFGAQLCSWIEYLDEPWKQPVFDASATRLSRFKKVHVPKQVFNVGFHRSSINFSETVHIYIAPKDKKVPTPIQWHSGKMAVDKKTQKNIQKIIDWAAIWFQIFKIQ